MKGAFIFRPKKYLSVIFFVDYEKNRQSQPTGLHFLRLAEHQAFSEKSEYRSCPPAVPGFSGFRLVGLPPVT